MELARRRVKAPADGRPINLYPPAEYWAGLFDGEGCVLIASDKGKSHHLRVTIVNTHLGVLQQLRHAFGGSLVPHHRFSDPRHRRHQPSWTWCATTRNAAEFLELIRDHSIVKQEQIDLALEFVGRRRKQSNRPLSDEELNMRSNYVLTLKELKRGTG